MFLILVALITMGPANSQSAAIDEDCSNLFTKIQPQAPAETKFIVINEHLLSEKQKKSNELLFDELARLTQGKVSLPKNQKIEIGQNKELAHYSDNVIHVPTEYKGTKYKKHPNHTQTVLSHEWGHALLETNLKERFPGLMQNQEKKEAFKMVFEPYNEFFADIIPVMRKNNGQAARDPIFAYAQRTESNINAEMRDFTIKHKLSGWNYEGPYALLSPSRYWLWENYLSRPQVQKAPGEVLDALIETLGSEISYRLQNPQLSLNPEQINQRFMKDFAERMKQRGL